MKWALRALVCLPLVIIAGGALLVSCGGAHTEEQAHAGYDFEGFVPQYNRFIRNMLDGNIAAIEGRMAEIEAQLAEGGEEVSETILEGQLAELEMELEKNRFRQELGDYFVFADIEDLPDDLEWEDGMDQPEIGDPRATKGGVFRDFIPSFPPTLRPFGPNSNHSFRSEMYDDIDIPLVNLHPDTMQIIPGVAREWAVSEDGHTVYYRLHENARYSDGMPVKAEHFLVRVYLMVSDNIVNPFSKQWFREQYAQMVVYDDHTLAVTLPVARPLMPYWTSLYAAAPHFYEEYGPDFAERFNWRVPPTTGAYTVLPEDIRKGVSITLTRVEDWWLKDSKYYRYRFNADRISYRVIRDESKAFEIFRAGELDFYPLTQPEYYHEKSEIEPVFNGYIERVTFYNEYPRPPRGLYLNVSKAPLDNLDVRIGIHHAMNWQRVIDVVFRGDYARMPTFAEGYGRFRNPNITARPFSISKAREHFRKAGFTEQGPDGILRKPDGSRLSVAVTYPQMPIVDRMMAILQEEARRAGLDLQLDGNEPTVNYQKTQRKDHQIAFAAWAVTPPFPEYRQLFHSSNAFDEQGNPRPQTNNLNVYADPRMDELTDRARAASTEVELQELCWEIEQIIHDEALWVPGYMTDFVRSGHWRWVRWPDSETTQFIPRVTFFPNESYVYWIDEAKREETQEAMRQRRTFPEVELVYDQYRVQQEEEQPEVVDQDETEVVEVGIEADDNTEPPESE